MSERHIVVHGRMRSPFAEHHIDPPRYTRTDARFLAHLVATRANTPEHRQRNKILPESGAAAYRLSQTKPPRGKPIFTNLSA